MKKKILASVLCGMIAASLFAACGGENETSQVEAAGKEAAAGAEKAGEETAAGIDAAGEKAAAETDATSEKAAAATAAGEKAAAGAVKEETEEPEKAENKTEGAAAKTDEAGEKVTAGADEAGEKAAAGTDAAGEKPTAGTDAASEKAAADKESADKSTANKKVTGDGISDLTIGYYMDTADDYYNCAFEVFTDLAASNDKTADWKIVDKVGQGTSREQIQAVDDFIAAGVDAIIVVQNSPETSAKCIDKANKANIPYFAMTRIPDVPKNGELAGFSGYDYEECGIYAGKDAIDHGVKKLIIMEEKAGADSASDQSLGFLKAYEDAGLNIGGTAEKAAANKTSGGKDLKIVRWLSGEGEAGPAMETMSDAIEDLGADGFDGVYVQNDEMMEGVLRAIEDTGLNPSDYWLGSLNGKEKSWAWVEEGKVTMDVNQTPSLEGDVMYQIVVDYFKTGEPRYLNPYVIPFNKDNIADLDLIPYDHVAYMAVREDIDTDIKGEAFKTAGQM